MTTNSNLNLLIQKMFDDEAKLEEIIKIDDMEELYQICLTIQDGYTLEEFVDFFENLVYICQDQSKEIDKLEDSELKDVSGGANNFNRVTASVLAATMALMGNSYYSRAHADNESVGEEIVWRKADDKEKEKIAEKQKEAEERKKLEDSSEFEYRSLSEDVPDDQLSGWGKAKKWLSKAADFVWDNKGKILLGCAALATVGGILVYESKQISDNLIAWSEARDEKKNSDKINKKNQQELDRLNIEMDKKRFDLNALCEELGVKNSEKLEEEIKNYDNIDEDKKKQLLELKKDFDDTQRKYNSLSDKIIMDAKRQKLNESGSTGKKLTEGLIIFGGLVTVADKSWELITKAYDKFKKVDDITRVFEDMHSRAEKFVEWYNKVNLRVNLWIQTHESKNYDYRDGAKRLDILYNNFIHGQEKAKKQLKQFYRKLAYSLDKEKKGIATERDLSAQILILNGPSGTGKTYMAQLLSSCLTNIEPFYINANDVLRDTGTWGNMETAFWAGGKKLAADVTKGQTNFNSLSSYISSTEGAVRVVIVDEYDKLYQLNTKNPNLDPAKHPLDEMFRKILDTNKYSDPYWGTEYDLSKTIFICTTNETSASLRGEIHYSGGDLFQDGVGEPEMDETGTQTLVPHDVSFLQRVSGLVCYFDSLKFEDYERIARDALGDDMSIKDEDDLQKIGGTDKVILDYRVNYDLGGIEIDDEGYRLIARYAMGMPSGARAIVGANGNKTGSVAGNLEDALGDYCSNQGAEGHSVKNLKLKAIPRLAKNSSGMPIVEFDIKPLGYVDR